MPIPHLPFELILEIADHLDLPTLNSLVKTHKRAAEALTKLLYHRSFSIFPESAYEPHDKPYQKDAPFFSLRMIRCIPVWSSDILLTYLFKKFTPDTQCIEDAEDPDAPDLPHYTSWESFSHIIAKHGNLNLVQTLISAGASLHTKAGYGDTLLHAACQNPQDSVPRYLLHAGSDLRIRNANGETVLHRAASTSSASLVEDVIAASRAAGLDIHARDQSNRTPLYCAICGDNGPAVDILLREGATPIDPESIGRDPLAEAISSRINPSIPRALLKAAREKGLDLSYRMRSGSTLLHLALDFAKIDLIQDLIDAGVDVNAANNNGLTPLHKAIKSRNKHTMKLLIQNGADPTAKDINGTTPLELTVSSHLQEFATLVLQGTPLLWEPDHRNSKIWRAISKATSSKKDYFKLLLPLIRAHPASPVTLDLHGNTALHLICQTPCTEPGPDVPAPVVNLAKIVLDSGGEIAPKNRKRLTPFHFAVWTPTVTESSTDLVQFLLRYQESHGVADGSGSGEEEQEGLDIEGAVYTLLKAAQGSNALQVDSAGMTPIDQGVEGIQDAVLRKRAERLLGWE